MNPSWVYLVQSAVWCAGGFLLGYVAGRTARDVGRIADATTPEVTPMIPTPVRRWHGIPLRGQTIVGAVVVLLCIAVIVQGYTQSSATERLARCHTEYANAFADALDARSRATQQAQDALDELTATFGALSATPPASEAELGQRQERIRQALSEYLAKRADAKTASREHPFPPPPRAACPDE
jgi:hypothetical protein